MDQILESPSGYSGAGAARCKRNDYTVNQPYPGGYFPVPHAHILCSPLFVHLQGGEFAKLDGGHAGRLTRERPELRAARDCCKG